MNSVSCIFMLDVHMHNLHIPGMTLTEYLSTYKHPDGKEGLSDAAFGTLCGMSQPQISRLKNEKSRPSYEAIEAIRAATAGKVSPNDWFAEAVQ